MSKQEFKNRYDFIDHTRSLMIDTNEQVKRETLTFEGILKRWEISEGMGIIEGCLHALENDSPFLLFLVTLLSAK